MNGETREALYFLSSISDLQLAEKEFKKNGERNLVTDFINDDELVATLKELKIRAQNAKHKVLVLNGDILDYQHVALFGKYLDPPFEAVAVRKTHLIFRMHPEILAALKELFNDGWTIVWIIGNHDVALSWPRVQEVITKYFARAASHERIIFGDEFEIAGFHFRHGYEVEPFNNVPPAAERFLDGYRVRIGKKHTSLWIPAPALPDIEKKEKHKVRVLAPCRILNVPIGNYLSTFLAIPLKQAGSPTKQGPHRWVGRMYTSSYIWRSALVYPRYWNFALLAFVLWLRGLIYVIFFEAFFDARRKISLSWFSKAAWVWFLSTLKNLVSISFLATRRDISLDQIKFGNQILGKRKEASDKPPLRAVVMGHTHKFGRWTSAVGTVFNTGSWIVTYSTPSGNDHGSRPKLITKFTLFAAEILSTDEVSADIFEYDRQDQIIKQVI